MRGGVILIVIALLVGFMGVTGRYKCFVEMLQCLATGQPCGCKGAGTGASPGAVGADDLILFPRVEPIRPIPPLTPGIAGPISI